MRVFGLTGGVASGKSTVARLLRARGVPIVVADEAARAIVAPGQPTARRIADRFGSGCFLADGTLDRKALGALIFADASARRALDAIVFQPLQDEIGRRLDALRRQGEAFAVLDAALIFEWGIERTLDGVVVVAAPREHQIARQVRRDGLSREQAEARVASQMPADEKVARADLVVDNGGEVGQLDAVVDALVAWMAAPREEER